ncbi:MAG: shikimate dehydrogenase [Planctomycetaceae bacterium]
MICISLGRTRHSSMREEHLHLAEKGAELVELRVDWMRKRPDVGRLLQDRPTPVIVTCRRQKDRGRWTGSEDQRLTLLREAIIGGAEYVDLEDDIAKSIPRYGSTKRIVSFHDFDETPYELFEIYERLKSCNPDIIKIVTMANSPEDNVRMLEMVSAADVPTVGFCMGEFGITSRILCGRFGSPFTYAGFSRDREMAPGQLTFAEVRNLYRYNKITKNTKLFGVVGDPIAHSMSPILHNAAFRKAGFDGVYLPLRIPADSFATTLREYAKLGFSGFSVTIPHKQAALDFADEADVQTDLIGASNTLFQTSGEWHATNTDYDAIIESVVSGLKATGVMEPRLTEKKVLILGAGGVARAAAHAMQQSKATVTVTNRTRDRAKALAAELGCLTIGWENRASEKCDILINCTSVGMHPNVNESPFQEVWMNESTLVFDTVYNPENTLFLKSARARGCPTVSGVEMFVRQAARQFEIFTGAPASLDYLAETMRRAMSAARQ